jgi:hypothetical protein
MRAGLMVIVSGAASWGCESEYGLGGSHDLDGVVADGAGAGTPQPDTTELGSDPHGADTTGADTAGLDPIPALPDTGLAQEDACEPGVALTTYLDARQVPGDGNVTFCHSGDGGAYLFLDTALSSCFAHLAHAWDVFPTTGCDS